MGGSTCCRQPLFLSTSGNQQPVPSTADLIQQALLDLDLSESDDGDDDDDMEFAEEEEDELEDEDELDGEYEDDDDDKHYVHYDELVDVNDNRTMMATSRDSDDRI